MCLHVLFIFQRGKTCKTFGHGEKLTALLYRKTKMQTVYQGENFILFLLMLQLSVEDTKIGAYLAPERKGII